MYRIQCKSSSYVRCNGVTSKEAFSFNATSATTNTKETITHRYTSKDIDYFATEFLGQVYIIPVDECGTNKTLRLSPPNNG